MPAHGGGLHAIGGRRSELQFAKAFPAVGAAIDSHRRSGPDPGLPNRNLNQGSLPLALAGVALNRGRGRRQEGIEPLLDDGITLAGRLFEAGTIDDLNPAAAVAD